MTIVPQKIQFKKVQKFPPPIYCAVQIFHCSGLKQTPILVRNNYKLDIII